ncbi:MAG TPA: hypothetical protein PLT08_02725 [Anaerolineales bacterium]|nr:hypothetical protein [Anaerolineales bacterium]HNE03407.1 hypothetical protein [Anaerolineales bacterium]
MSRFDNTRNLKIKPVFTIGAENTNAINVAIQLLNRDNGNELAERVGLQWYLSSDANGDAISAAPSGGIAIGTDGLLIEHTNNIAGKIISEADGDIDVTLTESTAKSFYLILIAPDGKLYPSGAITFA